ncbi:zinc finger BED domain-containing protein RICESLEEPER 2-like [Senna tora]|uniref:Zinc finger BED domain-containing protein RICESLEEPER 2-like n=1 Tax=Senna tora TaxID=362788 RepID=A0A834WKB1_9FABA|nr:zinc finger BED domain-containing protein RICESLEEPER 2-like [Senna tora]
MNSDNVDSSIGNMVKENVAKVSASSQKEDEPLSEKTPLSKKPKTFTSEVWKYFTRIGIVDGKEKAQCKDNVQAVICTQKWLHDFNFEDDRDDNDNSTSNELKNSKQDSNDCITIEDEDED